MLAPHGAPRTVCNFCAAAQRPLQGSGSMLAPWRNSDSRSLGGQAGEVDLAQVAPSSAIGQDGTLRSITRICESSVLVDTHHIKRLCHAPDPHAPGVLR